MYDGKVPVGARPRHQPSALGVNGEGGVDIGFSAVDRGVSCRVDKHVRFKPINRLGYACCIREIKFGTVKRDHFGAVPLNVVHAGQVQEVMLVTRFQNGFRELQAPQANELT